MKNENEELNENLEQTINPEGRQNFENNVKKQSISVDGIMDWVKSNQKLLIIIAIVAVVAIVAILVVPNLVGGPKQAAKKHISALNSVNGKKLAKTMDIRGVLAYDECSGWYTKDLSKFEDKYEEIKDKDIKKKKESIEETFDDLDKKKNKYSITLKEIKDVEEDENCKNLYTVEAKIRMKYKNKEGDTQDVTETVKIIVYKNKVIYSDILSVLKLASALD